MPRDTGPEMLAEIDRKLQDGSLDQFAYEARRAEVMELIRRKQAFAFSPPEKVVRLLLAVVLVLLGLFALPHGVGGGILGLFLIGAAGIGSVQVLRH